MRELRVLAIDPGIEGAAAVYWQADGGEPHLEATMLPTHGEDAKRRINAAALLAWIKQQSAYVGIVENVGPMQGWGLSSAFRFGRAAGYLEAVVVCAGLPLELVVPVKWKKFYNLIGADKEASRQKAIMLFPQRPEFFAKKGDGRQLADACLIAHYGWQMRNG